MLEHCLCWLRVTPFHISGPNSDSSNDYERQFDKKCKTLAIGTYTDLIQAFKACEQNSHCNYISDEYCDEKSKFSLCRAVKESESGSCVYKKRKLFLLLLYFKTNYLKMAYLES